MRILLIRHGRQNSPLCNVDVPLSEEGRAQADLLGERLKHEGRTASPALVNASAGLWRPPTGSTKP